MNFNIEDNGSRIIVTTTIHFPNDEWNKIMARIVRIKGSKCLELVGKKSSYTVIKESGSLEFYPCDTLITGGIQMIFQEIQSYTNYIENCIKEVLNFQTLYEISYEKKGE